MDTSNVIALVLGGVGFILSIINLIVTPLLNLKSKRLEQRLDYRFKLFQKILELWVYIWDAKGDLKNDFNPLMSEINKLIQLYGYNSEISLFKKFNSAINDSITEQDKNRKEEKMKTARKIGEQFFEHCFNAYRKELVLDKLPD